MRTPNEIYNQQQVGLISTDEALASLGQIMRDAAFDYAHTDCFDSMKRYQRESEQAQYFIYELED